MPNLRNTFYRYNVNFPGQKKTDRQIDATGMLALGRFGAICDSLSTPRNMRWHGLQSTNAKLNNDRNVRVWFEKATNVLFQQRYAPTANFMKQNQLCYRMGGAFGNLPMFIDQLVDMHGRPARGFRYKALSVGEVYIRENHQGQVDCFLRAFRMTARQVEGKWPGKLPPALRTAYELNSEALFDFFHVVCPNKDYDPDRLDHKGKSFASYYVSVQGRCVMQIGGYRMFPLAYGRYNQEMPTEVYGRGPAMDVLPALKTLNAEKKIFLKTGHRASDPVLLTTDDGVIDGFSFRNGAMNKGAMSEDGKPLVTTLPTGNIQITKEMMDEERQLINDAFLVSLFQILTESPQMTATEVMERINEKGILLAPTVGGLQSDYIGPIINREIDLAVELGMLEPMPPLLREAKGEYEVVYTSPLAKAARAQEATGFWRAVEQATSVMTALQDPSVMDVFDFDTAIPETADINGTPITWMSSPDKIASKRQARAKAQAKQQAIQAAPAQAALVKANAVAQKNGAQQPQQPQQAQQPQAPQGAPPVPGQ